MRGGGTGLGGPVWGGVTSARRGVLVGSATLKSLPVGWQDAGSYGLDVQKTDRDYRDEVSGCAGLPAQSWVCRSFKLMVEG
jgi:hypothetical protein